MGQLSLAPQGGSPGVRELTLHQVQSSCAGPPTVMSASPFWKPCMALRHRRGSQHCAHSAEAGFHLGRRCCLHFVNAPQHARGLLPSQCRIKRQRAHPVHNNLGWLDKFFFSSLPVSVSTANMPFSRTKPGSHHSSDEII